MYRLFISLLFVLSLTVSGFAQGAKTAKKAPAGPVAKGDYVDIGYSKDSINAKRKQIEKLNSDNSKMTSENSESQNQISQAQNTISKIDALIEKLAVEKNKLEKISKVIVDNNSSNINSTSLATCNDNIMKLNARKGEMNRIVQMHEQKILVNKKKIDENNNSIKRLNEEINQLEISIKKTEDQRKTVEGYKNSMDSLAKEVDGLLNTGN